MAASNLNLGKASGGVLNIQPADGTTTTSLVLPAINGTVVAADSNGNVGIGTSSTVAKLTINHSMNAGEAVRIGNSVGGWGDIQGSTYIGLNHWGVADSLFSSALIGVIEDGASSYNASIIFSTRGSGTDSLATERMRIDPVGNVLVTNSTGGLGYGTGAGGTVTQLTSKSTDVTLNKPSGIITMNNAALAAGTSVYFQLNNSLLSATDQLLYGGYYQNANPQQYRFETAFTSYGYANIRVTNITGVSLSEAIQFNFSILKGAIA